MCISMWFGIDGRDGAPRQPDCASNSSGDDEAESLHETGLAIPAARRTMASAPTLTNAGRWHVGKCTVVIVVHSEQQELLRDGYRS